MANTKITSDELILLIQEKNDKGEKLISFEKMDIDFSNDFLCKKIDLRASESIAFSDCKFIYKKKKRHNIDVSFVLETFILNITKCKSDFEIKFTSVKKLDLIIIEESFKKISFKEVSSQSVILSGSKLDIINMENCKSDIFLLADGGQTNKRSINIKGKDSFFNDFQLNLTNRNVNIKEAQFNHLTLKGENNSDSKVSISKVSLHTLEIFEFYNRGTLDLSDINIIQEFQALISLEEVLKAANLVEIAAKAANLIEVSDIVVKAAKMAAKEAEGGIARISKTAKKEAIKSRAAAEQAKEEVLRAKEEAELVEEIIRAQGTRIETTLQKISTIEGETILEEEAGKVVREVKEATKTIKLIKVKAAKAKSSEATKTAIVTIEATKKRAEAANSVAEAVQAANSAAAELEVSVKVRKATEAVKKAVEALQISQKEKSVLKILNSTLGNAIFKNINISEFRSIEIKNVDLSSLKTFKSTFPTEDNIIKGEPKELYEIFNDLYTSSKNKNDKSEELEYYKDLRMLY